MAARTNVSVERGPVGERPLLRVVGALLIAMLAALGTVGVALSPGARDAALWSADPRLTVEPSGAARRESAARTNRLIP